MAACYRHTVSLTKDLLNDTLSEREMKKGGVVEPLCDYFCYVLLTEAFSDSRGIARENQSEHPSTDGTVVEA